MSTQPDELLRQTDLLPQVRSEIAFIDPSVNDVAVLLAGLRPEVEPILLRRGEPASAQMARVVDGYRDLDAVHILAHGRSGAVDLTGGELSVDGIMEYAEALTAIGRALGAHGGLRVWSCHAGHGPAGHEFLQAVKDAVGTPVAAASGLIGAEALGGAWVLDVDEDGTDAYPPLTVEGLAGYQGLLGNIGSASAVSITPDNGASNTDFITNVLPNSVRISYSVQGGGTDTIRICFAAGANNTGTGTIYGTSDILSGSGQTSINLSGTALTSGTWTLQIIDESSNKVIAYQNITIDAAAPTAVATVTAISSDTGSSSTDFNTNVASQTVSGTFTGTLGGSESIQVSANGGTTWVTATAGSGTWSASGVTLTSGTGTLSVRTIDTAGNATSGTGHSYTLDQTAPTAISSDTGSSSTDFNTNVASQTVSGTFTGTLGGSESIQVSADGGTTWVTATAGSGTWSASGVTLTSGTGTLSVRTIDTAGNATSGTGHSYTLDQTAPTLDNVSDGTGSTSVTQGIPVTLTLHFNENVTADSSSTIGLNVPGTVTYLDGSGTQDLKFIFTPSTNASNVKVTSVTGVTDTAGTPPTGVDDVICFMAGTMILTPSGHVPVETLQRGDLVLTSTGAVQPVQWLGRQTVSTLFADPLRVLPIRVKAGALDDSLPERDLLASPDHALLIGDILVQAGALVNGLSIVREEDVPTTFTYYHIELADHALILAEGVPAETFIDNVDRMAFDNWDEHEALYPEGIPLIVEMDLPRAKSHRQVPRAIRERLMARATTLFGKVEQAAY